VIIPINTDIIFKHSDLLAVHVSCSAPCMKQKDF